MSCENCGSHEIEEKSGDGMFGANVIFLVCSKCNKIQSMKEREGIHVPSLESAKSS